MNYTDMRARRREQCKVALLRELRQAEAKEEPVNLNELALKLDRSRSGLMILWHELAAEGQIVYPAEDRLNNGRQPAIPTPPDLAERIEAVRQAKIEKTRQERKRNLDEDELEEILP